MGEVPGPHRYPKITKKSSRCLKGLQRLPEYKKYSKNAGGKNGPPTARFLTAHTHPTTSSLEVLPKKRMAYMEGRAATTPIW